MGDVAMTPDDRIVATIIKSENRMVKFQIVYGCVLVTTVIIYDLIKHAIFTFR